MGKKVAAHAIGDQATRIAAEAGADSIEHAYTIPDDVLKMMAEKKIFLVPTDHPVQSYVDIFLKSKNLSHEEMKQQESMMKVGIGFIRKRLERAVKAGVPMRRTG